MFVRMTDKLETDPTPPRLPDRTAEIDAVLAEFEGDARKALAALLHDLEALAADRASTVSFGYVRGLKARAGRR